MILVIAEQKDGKLNRASIETIAAAQQLAGTSGPIKIAIAGHNVGPVASDLAQYGEVVAVDHAALAPYTPDAFVQALQQS
jgi:electron transfer flavoprotein alpha subunit